MGEDQLYVNTPPYKPRRVLETVSIEWLATYFEQLPTRSDMWRAALLGTLTGAAIVIGWIELIHASVCRVRGRPSPYRLLATVLNVLVRLVPTNVIITMAATAISAAIRPYSIAVTPRLSLTKRVSTYRIISSSR